MVKKTEETEEKPWAEMTPKEQIEVLEELLAVARARDEHEATIKRLPMEARYRAAIAERQITLEQEKMLEELEKVDNKLTELKKKLPKELQV